MSLFGVSACSAARRIRIRIRFRVFLLVLAPTLIIAAPQNHKTVPHNGVCERANLSPRDFCYDVVTYPIASTLVKSHESVVSPRHIKEHQKLVDQNDVTVLSEKASKEFDFLMNHHLDSSRGHQNIRQVMADTDENFDGDGSHAKCETLLKKYVCQNQFPRCFDDPAYVSPDEPVHLHLCYSLCHEVAETCGLTRRINCHLHHIQLNHEWQPPTEHQLRFDPQYRESDPYADFWRIDCIDSPPSSWKYLFHYLIYGGPGSAAAYTITALILYAIIARVMGLSKDSPTATVAKLRTQRLARRVAFETKMKKQQKKYIKLQEIKTVMLEQQEQQQATLDASPASASSPSSSVEEIRSAVRERAAKLSQLDTLLHDLEQEIQIEFLAMQQVLEEEAKENAELGFGGPEGERLLAQAEAELDGQDDDNAVKVFGQRRRRPQPVDAPDEDVAEDEEDDDYVKPSVPRKR